MDSHKHAALTPRGRALLVYRVLHEGCKVRDASSAAGVNERTATSGWRDSKQQALA
jgi:hypothetical protein